MSDENAIGWLVVSLVGFAIPVAALATAVRLEGLRRRRREYDRLICRISGADRDG